VKNSHKTGVQINKIAQITRLTPEEVEKIISGNDK
jgi:hypothetical protein